MSTRKVKRKPGRPAGPPTVVVPLRLPEPLAARLQDYANGVGTSRNQAGILLLEQALAPPRKYAIGVPYNPETGDFDE